MKLACGSQVTADLMKRMDLSDIKVIIKQGHRLFVWHMAPIFETLGRYELWIDYEFST